MKVAGMFLLCTGFAIVASTLVLLPSGTARNTFVLTGLAVQIFGLVLAFCAHYTLGEGAR